MKTDIKLSTTTLEQIRIPVMHDLQGLNRLICEELVSDINLIQAITAHIINSGGKRLRPLLVILSARACGYQSNDEHLELAAIIEFVHTATLLHDDVVDESQLRRGKNTANAIWGNQASVLVGDFLYSRAFQLLAKRSNVPVMKVLADTTNAIAEGEVLQLMNRNDPDINEATYMQVITRKTARLFESSAQTGAMLGSRNHNIHQALATYGLNIGLAFQIVDDLLDYTASSEQMGKNVGDDLAEGKMTLPLIYAMQKANPEIIQAIREAVTDGGLERLDTIIHTLHETNAIARSQQKARALADTARQAISILPTSDYQQSLDQLVDFVIERTY